MLAEHVRRQAETISALLGRFTDSWGKEASPSVVERNRERFRRLPRPRPVRAQSRSLLGEREYVPPK